MRSHSVARGQRISEIIAIHVIQDMQQIDQPQVIPNMGNWMKRGM